MTWEVPALEILRVLINDLGHPAIYEDCKLEKILYVAAMQVVREVTFDTVYTVNILSQTITPSPDTDNDFLVLASLKAACIIAQGEMKVGAAESIRVIDGPSTIDITNKFNGLKLNLSTSCDAFEDAKREFISSNTIGAAILGPYAPGLSYGRSLYP